MTQNLFEELQEKKDGLLKLAAKAVEYGWITQERFQEMVSKLDNDTLTIGVIGQMKCGKSTFLNSFVFKDNILPAATTPMTAALSVITYGKEKKIVAEFYTQEEWTEQKMQASRSLADVAGNSLEESKIKAAKELVEKSSKLGGALDNYLGEKKEDKLENLIEYVGADGKYISITKSVTIYYPKEYLRGIEVVDTPGFNDPIVSREERTKAFLKKADVVLLMLYAGRPFDVTDRDILFKNVRQCGIGKVIIGINKYDIPYENGDKEDKIKQYVTEQINAACNTCNDDTLVEVLKDSEPIPLSAEMALLSEMPFTKISKDERLKFAWDRATRLFDISSPVQIRENSHIDDLIAAIKRVIEVEKAKILFAKPLNSIFAAGNDKIGELEKELQTSKSMLQNLNTPEDELESKLRKLERTHRRLNRKIDSLSEDIDYNFQNIVEKGERNLENEVDATCTQMHKIVDDWKRWEKIDGIFQKLDAQLQNLLTRKLKRKVEDLGEEACKKVDNSVRDFILDIENDILRILDMDPKDCDSFMSSLRNKLRINQNEDIFKFDSTNEEKNYGWGDVIWDFLNGATWGLLDLAGRILSYEENKTKLKEHIDSISNDFDPKPMLESIYQQKDTLIECARKELLDEYLDPMQKQIKEIQSKKEDRKKASEECEKKCKDLEKKQEKLEQQLEEMKQLKSSLNL